jgi:hypothetical protein
LIYGCKNIMITSCVRASLLALASSSRYMELRCNLGLRPNLCSWSRGLMTVSSSVCTNLSECCQFWSASRNIACRITRLNNCDTEEKIIFECLQSCSTSRNTACRITRLNNCGEKTEGNVFQIVN